LTHSVPLTSVYFKPYESNGEAWKITFDRLVWSLVLFQVFVTGLFSLSKSFWLVALMVPLILYTTWWGWVMSRDFTPLSKYLALSNVCDVQRGEQPAEVLEIDDHVPRTLSGLNHKRYAINDDTLYVAPADKRTDYSQPPMNSFYYGVLNTGKKRYGHPALTGSLPKPWLPAKYQPPAFGDNAPSRKGIVLSLRRKMAKKLRRNQSTPSTAAEEDEPNGRRDVSGGTFGTPEGWGTSFPAAAQESTDTSAGADAGNTGSRGTTYSSSTINSNPWLRDSTPSNDNDHGMPRRLSVDVATGTIALGDEHVWCDDGDHDDHDEDEDDSPGEPAEPASPVSLEGFALLTLSQRTTTARIAGARCQVQAPTRQYRYSM